ncbi:MAG: hypothetical protein AABW49_03035 [Nanoarchaeota archaeon]
MKDYTQFSFIFIGDTHGFLDDFSKQKEIIKKTQPEIVLSEQLQHINLESPEDYEKIQQEKKISNMVAYEEVEKLIALCKEQSIKLKGFDLETFGFDKTLQEVIQGKRLPTHEEEQKIEEIVKKRTQHHLKLLKDNENTSQKPIIVILGTFHLIDEGEIVKTVKNSLLIRPTDKEGKLLLEPPETIEGITYTETTR